MYPLLLALGIGIGWVVRDMVQVYRDEKLQREYDERHPDGTQEWPK